MQKKKLGNTDLHTAPIIFGGNIFGWTVDEKRSFELLDAFVESGFNMIDTADAYSRWVPGNKGGESETIIGNWMKARGNRDRIVISTKFGADFGNGPDLSAVNLKKSVEASLRRLQTGHIDLHFSHFDDGTTPAEETLGAYTELVKEGKIRFIGTSNMSRERVQQSLTASADKKLAKYDVLQPLYNLYDREKFESEYRDLCLDNGIIAIPYYALASGFLTGKYRSGQDLSKSQRGGGIKKYLTDRGFRILAALDQVSSHHHATPAQVAIAWLIAQPAIGAAIASATSLEQWKELAAGAALSLSETELEALSEP